MKTEKRDIRLEILAALRASPDLTPTELGRELGIGPRSVSAALTDLTKISNELPCPFLKCALVKEGKELNARRRLAQAEPQKPAA